MAVIRNIDIGVVQPFNQERYSQELTLAILQSDFVSTLKHYSVAGQADQIDALVKAIMKKQS